MYMKYFEHKHFDGVVIEPGCKILRLDYSEEEQGHIYYQYHFRISITGEATYEEKCSKKDQPIFHIQPIPKWPPCVRKHAQDWLNHQIDVASKSKKNDLAERLCRFLTYIEE